MHRTEAREAAGGRSSLLSTFGEATLPWLSAERVASRGHMPAGSLLTYSTK